MGRNKSNKKKASRDEVDEAGLDRFAGSSEEEDNVNAAQHVDHEEGSSSSESGSDSEDEGDDDNEQPSKTTENDNDEQQDETDMVQAFRDQLSGKAGMANAMARILGTGGSNVTKKRKPKAVVLSKTKTPLQRQAEEERKLERELREKQRRNRERSLAAFHVPLSVATTSPIDDDSSQAIAKELQQERALRRVATRGVVALFNAIAQHQKDANEPEPSSKPQSTTGGGKDTNRLTKHAFLDMIKSKAQTAAPISMRSKHDAPPAALNASNVASSATDSHKPQWNALQDDLLLNPKKNWDQDETSSSDDEEEAGEDSGDDDGNQRSSSKSSNNRGRPSKRRRVGVR